MARSEGWIPPMAEEARRPLHYRMLQAALAYLAASWGVVEAAGFFSGHYRWAPGTVDSVIAILAAGFPACLLLVWRHGSDGSPAPRLGELVPPLAVFLLCLPLAWIAARTPSSGSEPRPSSTLAKTEASPLPTTRVALQIRNQPLDRVLQVVARMFGLGCSVPTALGSTPMSVQLSDVDLRTALESLARQAQLRIGVRQGIIEARALRAGEDPGLDEPLGLR